jgi:NAD(P)-dependent dehydrogenase (short-subunit alcohol dehydrogenase family)
VDLGLDGRVALLTASPRGLGRASAQALSQEGAKVVLWARDGLWAWAKTAAADQADDGITLNLACPGTHATERMRQRGGLGGRRSATRPTSARSSASSAPTRRGS